MTLPFAFISFQIFHKFVQIDWSKNIPPVVTMNESASYTFDSAYICPEPEFTSHLQPSGQRCPGHELWANDVGPEVTASRCRAAMTYGLLCLYSKLSIHVYSLYSIHQNMGSHSIHITPICCGLPGNRIHFCFARAPRPKGSFWASQHRNGTNGPAVATTSPDLGEFFSTEMSMILLMEEIRNNQLRLVVYPIIDRVLYTSQVVQDFFLQQYFICVIKKSVSKLKRMHYARTPTCSAFPRFSRSMARPSVAKALHPSAKGHLHSLLWFFWVLLGAHHDSKIPQARALPSPQHVMLPAVRTGTQFPPLWPKMPCLFVLGIFILSLLQRTVHLLIQFLASSCQLLLEHRNTSTSLQASTCVDREDAKRMSWSGVVQFRSVQAHVIKCD